MAARKKKAKKKTKKKPVRRRKPKVKKPAGREPGIMDLVMDINPVTKQEEEVTVARAIIRRVENGMSLHAAGLTVVPERTFYRWLSRGEAVAAQGPENAPESEAVYWQLWQGLQRARAHGRAHLELLVRQHAENDGKLALEMLSRLYPKDYGRRLHVNHAIKMEDLGQIIEKVGLIILRHVVDPDKRLAIAEELVELVPIEHREVATPTAALGAGEAG